MVPDRIRGIGEQLRSRVLRKDMAQAEKETQSEVKRLKPEICINPLLTLALDAFHLDQADDFDPACDSRAVPAGLDEMHAFRIGARALADVYEPDLRKKKRWPTAGLTAQRVEWIKSLRTVAES